MEIVGNEHTVRAYSRNREISNNQILKTNDIIRIDNKKYKVAILGDVTYDGKVNANDVKKIIRIVKKQISSNYVEKVATDVNEDGKLNKTDVEIANKIYKNEYVEQSSQFKTQQQYTITYNLNGGSNPGNPTIYSEVDTFTLKNPSKNGWHIWFTDDDKSHLFYVRNNKFVKSEFIDGYWLRSDGTWDEKQQAKWHKGKNEKYWYGYSNESWYVKSKTYWIDGSQYQFDSSGYCTSGRGC